MDFWDYQDVVESVLKIPDISEGFSLVFLKSPSKPLPLDSPHVDQKIKGMKRGKR